MRRAVTSMMRLLSGRADALERKIGYRFRKKKLLEQALVHPSFRYETERVREDNQRMEFLGDAALGLAAAAHIYNRFRDKEEGALTALRSRITSGKALNAMSQTLGLGARLQIGRGEEMTGGRKRASNLADALEAVIGAAYLDGGQPAVEKIFRKLFVPLLDGCAHDFWSDNPKGRLQDLGQRVLRSVPQYRIVREDGPSHRRVYTIEVTVCGRVMGTGAGANKRDAQAEAARQALVVLEREGTIRKE